MKENTKSENIKWKALKEICKISTGKLNANEKVENGEYPFFTCQKTPNKIDKYSFDTEAVLMAGNGNVGNVHYYSGKFVAYQRTYIIESSEVNIKFLYYYLKTFFKGYIENYKKEGIISYITLPVLEKFLVPLPPLKKQEEIAAVLDKFTELTEELTAREAQYEYYRNMLLNENYLNKISEKLDSLNNVNDKVEWKTLENIFKIISGGDIDKKSVSKEKNQKYNIQVLSNGIEKNSIYGWTTIEKINEPSITISARGTIGWVNYVEEKFYPIVRLIVLTPKIEVNLRYTYYYMKTQEKNYNIPKMGIPQLTIPMIINKKIPLPSLPVQEYIVSILDKFDALINDLSQGLPKEIELRQKQYEYYREKLLTFK